MTATAALCCRRGNHQCIPHRDATGTAYWGWSPLSHPRLPVSVVAPLACVCWKIPRFDLLATQRVAGATQKSEPNQSTSALTPNRRKTSMHVLDKLAGVSRTRRRREGKTSGQSASSAAAEERPHPNCPQRPTPQ